MNHDDVRGLQIQLSAALRERDNAREVLANAYAEADHLRSLRATQDAELVTLRVEVKRLREALNDLSEALLSRRDAIKDPHEHRARLAYENAASMARAALAGGGDRG